MNVEDIVRERIEAARIRAERRKRERAELAEARQYGLTARHRGKLIRRSTRKNATS
ncbi:hypothetical protein [Streptomyces sp. NPDC054940]